MKDTTQYIVISFRPIKHQYLYWSHKYSSCLQHILHSLVKLQITQGDTGGAHEVIRCQIAVVDLFHVKHQQTVDTEGITDTLSTVCGAHTTLSVICFCVWSAGSDQLGVYIKTLQ